MNFNTGAIQRRRKKFGHLHIQSFLAQWHHVKQGKLIVVQWWDELD